MLFSLTDVQNDEEPYPSLSDFHDYEPNLEFDDTELQTATADPGMYLIFSVTYPNVGRESLR